MKRNSILAAGAFLLMMVAGCAVRPEGESDQRRLADELGRPYERPIESRDLPPLAPDAPWPEVLRRAFLADAGLEMAFWEWRAALERVPQESSQMTSPAVSFQYLFEGGEPTAWDRTTLGLMNDPMNSIELPSKRGAAGRRALEEARAAGRRFEAAKFDLQARVLKTWYEWSLLAESIRLQQSIVASHGAIASSEDALYRAGKTGQAMILEHHNTLDLAESRLAELESQVPGVRARLNALMGRGTIDSLVLPPALPEPRRLSLTDAEIFAMAAERNPELLEVAALVKGKEEALTIARNSAIPDFGLEASLTGSMEKMIGGMLTLPFFRRAAIRGAIDEARAEIRAMRALRVQKERDVAATAVIDLTALRDAERKIRLFDEAILVRSEMNATAGRSRYETGRGMLGEWQESVVDRLEAELMLAELRMERESRLADIEKLAAIDVERAGAPPEAQ